MSNRGQFWNRMHAGAGGVAIAAVAFLGAWDAAWAQVLREPDGYYVTREALETRLAEAQRLAASNTGTRQQRQDAEQEAELLRRRLEEGDFRPGDRIVLYVANRAALTDTYTVAPGPELRLPDVGELPLHGVLRAELQPHLTAHLRRFFVDPNVQAEALIRVSITGEVASPGFYVVPVTALVTDVLMTAGGPTRGARLDRIRIERRGEPIWDGLPMQDAIVEGQTLDQLGALAGDQIVVPMQRRTFDTIRNVLMLVPSVVLLVTLIA